MLVSPFSSDKCTQFYVMLLVCSNLRLRAWNKIRRQKKKIQIERKKNSAPEDTLIFMDQLRWESLEHAILISLNLALPLLVALSVVQLPVRSCIYVDWMATKTTTTGKKIYIYIVKTTCLSSLLHGTLIFLCASTYVTWRLLTSLLEFAKSTGWAKCKYRWEHVLNKFK